MNIIYITIAIIIFLISNSLTLANENSTIKSLSDELTIDIGKDIYFYKTRDACVNCHGDITKKSNEAIEESKKIQIEKNSANLIKPSTWIAFRALGGQNKKEVNPDIFESNLNQIIIQLIKTGAHNWNREFYKKASNDFGFDWQKVKGKDSYDSHMKGINISAQKIILKKLARTLKKKGYEVKRDELSEIAAYAVFRFVEKYNDE